jgi:hypothetical protein
MTQGRVVAPRSMPDEAPGLEQTINHCYYNFLTMGLGRSSHKKHLEHRRRTNILATTDSLALKEHPR